MKCPKCGFDIGDYPFCPKCGTKVQQEIQEEQHLLDVMPNKQPDSEAVNDTTAVKTDQVRPDGQSKKVPVFWIIAGACLILLLIVVLATNSGNKKTSTSSSAYSSSSSSSSTYTKVGFTDSELETLACGALYDTLMSSKSKHGIAFSKSYNIDSTRYSIGSIKGDSYSGWTVKGTFSLYNDYGEYKKSGTFTARISSSGYATCSITID